jgi:hypothetical protein
MSDDRQIARRWDDPGVDTMAEQAAAYQDVLEHFLDLAGQLVTAHASGWVVHGRVERTEVHERDGRRRAALRIGDAGAAVIVHEDGLLQCGWESLDEREWLAIIDGHGNRELMIELERER